jgi:hypothetical protein
MRLPLLVVAALLTACSGGGEDATSSPSPSRTGSQPIILGSTLAARIDCRLYERDNGSTELYVLEAGACVYDVNTDDPVEVYVRTFVTNDARDQWLTVARGVIGGLFAVGDRAVVYGDVPEVAQTAAPLFDAEVQ